MKREPDEQDEPLDRLFKLLPSESTAAFLLMRGYFPYDPATDGFNPDLAIYWGLVLTIVALTPLLLFRVLNVKSKKIVTFLTATLVIWVLNIDIVRAQSLGEGLAAEFATDFFVYLFKPELLKGLLIVWAIMLVPLTIPKKKTARAFDQEEDLNA